MDMPVVATAESTAWHLASAPSVSLGTLLIVAEHEKEPHLW